MIIVLANVKLHAVAAQARQRKVVFVQVYRQYSFRRNASLG